MGGFVSVLYGGVAYTLNVNNGALTSTQAGGNIY